LPDPDAVRTDLIAAVHQALEPGRINIWLARGGTLTARRLAGAARCPKGSGVVGLIRKTYR
jgi:hypothetical protein